MSKGRWGSESPNLHPTKKSNPSCRSMLSEQRMRVWHDGSCSPQTRLWACKADKCYDWKESRETGEWFANERGPTEGWSTALRMDSKPEQGMGPGALACVPPLVTHWCTRKEPGRKADSCWTQLALLLHFFYFFYISSTFLHVLGILTSGPAPLYLSLLCCRVMWQGERRWQEDCQTGNLLFSWRQKIQVKWLGSDASQGLAPWDATLGYLWHWEAEAGVSLSIRQWWFAVSFWEGRGTAGTHWHPSWGQLRGFSWLCASSEGSWRALRGTCSGVLWITRKVFFQAEYKWINVLWK